MRKLLSTMVGTLLLGSASLGIAAEIDVMTQNQYLGADLTPVLGASSAEEFNLAVVATLAKIAASRPAARVEALAAEIAQRHPDVVGLQEAYRFGCVPYPGVPVVAGTGCDDPAIKDAFSDQLLNTEAALRGKYRVAGRVTNFQVEAIPFVVNGMPAILQVADRDAILVRNGLPASAVPLAAMTGCQASDDGCNFAIAPEIPTPFGPIAVKRGFLAVDLAVKGQTYRVFNTHLEQRLLAPTLPQTRGLQVLQASELLQTAVATWQDPARKLIVVGDLNSAPEDTIPGLPTPYQIFTMNGFTDAWTLRPQTEPGLTCCQSETLTNRSSELYERIDMIFSFTMPRRVLDMKLLGVTMGDKTRPPGAGGLWPSDHAAVAAKLQFD